MNGFWERIFYMLIGAALASFVWVQSYLTARQRIRHATAEAVRARTGWKRSNAAWGASITRIAKAAGIVGADLDREALRMLSKAKGNPEINAKGGEA